MPYYALPLKGQPASATKKPTPSDRRIINANGDNVFWPPPSLEVQWQPLRIDLYVRIHEPEEFRQHGIAPSNAQPRLDERSCTLMARQQVCSVAKTEMLHQGDQVWATSDEVEVAFPGAFAGLFKGRQSSTATNCFAQRASLFVKRHNLELLVLPIAGQHKFDLDSRLSEQPLQLMRLRASRDYRRRLRSFRWRNRSNLDFQRSAESIDLHAERSGTHRL
uniref:Restriction endonuclease n=1 Tax=Globodera pallida TaxID=36090 RepID=A0A183BLD3_GLOPA